MIEHRFRQNAATAIGGTHEQNAHGDSSFQTGRRKARADKVVDQQQAAVLRGRSPIALSRVLFSSSQSALASRVVSRMVRTHWGSSAVQQQATCPELREVAGDFRLTVVQGADQFANA
jgi:hypothetical protein